jgi:hypothetical protein
MILTGIGIVNESPQRAPAFIAVGTNDYIQYSFDGITWTESRTSQTDNTFWKCGAYSASLNRFAIVSSTQNNGAYSGDLGVNWSNSSTPISPSNWGDNCMAYAPELGVFAAGSVGGRTESTAFISSTDGISWTSRAAPSGSSENVWRGMCWGREPGLFVAVGDIAAGATYALATSANGTTWTERTASSQSRWAAVAWGNAAGVYCAVAYTGQIMTSPDGITWTARTAASGVTVMGAVAWSPVRRIFCAVGPSGTNRCSTSLDGITWTERTIPSNSWNSIVWNDRLGLFVACNSDGTTSGIATSPDGVTWTTRTTSSNSTIISLAVAN